MKSKKQFLFKQRKAYIIIVLLTIICTLCVCVKLLFNPTWILWHMAIASIFGSVICLLIFLPMLKALKSDINQMS